MNLARPTARAGFVFVSHEPVFAPPSLLAALAEIVVIKCHAWFVEVARSPDKSLGGHTVSDYLVAASPSVRNAGLASCATDSGGGDVPESIWRVVFPATSGR